MSENIYEACVSATPNDGSLIMECVATSMNRGIANVDQRVDSLAEGLDVFFLLYASVIMFTMQLGFAMLCSGSVRKKNVQNTLLKNFLDACGCGVAFFAFGYAFAYGGTDGVVAPSEFNAPRERTTFLGFENFFLIGTENYAFWLYQYAFAATSTTIVAGTLAERSQMVSYFLYSVLLSGFVYPLVAHSIWSVDGFLNPFTADRFLGSGVVDFAGSAVVHVTGGFTALIASWILGPRRDRFHDDLGNPLHAPKHIQGYSVSLQVMGTFLLWFGWYGFNTGSVHFVSTGEYARVAALSAVTTTLGAACGTITSLAASAFWTQRHTGEITFDITYALNGCLSGLVGITAGCALVEPWAALIIGGVSGLLYNLGSGLLVRLQIDDAVDAIPVHLCNGIWGAIAVGLFASPQRMEAVFHRSDHVGWFYSWGRGSGDARLLAANIVGVLFILGVVLVVMLPFFWVLLYLGWFRADPLEEIVGLDIRYKGEADHEEYMHHHGITNGKHLHADALKSKLKRFQFETGMVIEENDDDLEAGDGDPETATSTTP